MLLVREDADSSIIRVAAIGTFRCHVCIDGANKWRTGAEKTKE